MNELNGFFVKRGTVSAYWYTL